MSTWNATCSQTIIIALETERNITQYFTINQTYCYAITERFTCSPAIPVEPVSYTHLDVYKRQIVF